MIKQITYWVKNYGSAGIPDQRAVQDYMECETAESVSSLRNELMAVMQGTVRTEVLDKIVGPARRLRHEDSYIEWAKIMLQWIAAYRG